MSLCSKCAEVAAYNRAVFEEHGRRVPNMRKHPKNCGCPCQHRKVDVWEKLFSVERPGE